MLEGKRQKAEGMKTFVSTTPKVDSEDEDEDGDGYLSFEHGRRKHGTFKATCTRFLSLIFTLVFLGICAAALLFYQELPVGHYQDVDSITMLYDHRKAATGIEAEHDSFRKESWKRFDVDVSSFSDDVLKVSEHIPVALYCGGTASLCEVEFEVQCLSDLTAVNLTHSKVAPNDKIEGKVTTFTTCGDFNLLSWREKAPRLRVMYHALTGTYVTLGLEADSAQVNAWNSWLCTNWNNLQNLATPCTRKIDLCVPTTQALTSMKNSASNLDFFRLANSASCGQGPEIEVYYKSAVSSTLDIGDRDYGWVTSEEIEAFFNQSFSQIFGSSVTEPYGRLSITSILRVGGKEVALDFITKSAGDMSTAEYVGAMAAAVSIVAVPGSCPNTGHEIFYGVGTIDLQLEAYNSSEVAMVAVSVGDDSVKYVPYYEVTADSDWTSYSIKRISALEIKVGKSAVSNAWRVVELRGTYDSPYSPGGGSSIEVQVELRHVSEPQELFLPKLEMEYYTLAALALAAISGIILVILPYILYHEYKQGLLANGLPLPFFRYTTQFRGW